MQACAAGKETFWFRVVLAMNQAHELAGDVAVEPGWSERVFGGEPVGSLRWFWYFDHSLIMPALGRVALGITEVSSRFLSVKLSRVVAVGHRLDAVVPRFCLPANDRRRTAKCDGNISRHTA